MTLGLSTLEIGALSPNPLLPFHQRTLPGSQFYCEHCVELAVERRIRCIVLYCIVINHIKYEIYRDFHTFRLIQGCIGRVMESFTSCRRILVI